MALTPEQIAARQGKLTASTVGALVSGDKERVLNLWREMVGDPSYVEPVWEDIWDVQIGNATEKLNLDWYEKKTGNTLGRRGSVIVHPDYDWAAATLDGFDEHLGRPVEAKHVGGYEKLETVIQRYMPQCQWQMEVTQSKQCALSIIIGKQEPYVEIINYDKPYADELLARGLRFMQHVWAMTEPVVIEQAPRPVAYSKMREINMTGNNVYADWADKWVKGHIIAKDFKEAETKLKEMMPDDAKRIFGHLIQLKRNKGGSIRITALD